MLTVRAYKPEDYEACLKLLPAGAVFPPQAERPLIAVMENAGRVTGWGLIRHKYQLEPLAAEDGFTAGMFCMWLDGRLADVPQYEFFVLDSNPTFQRFVEKHFPVTELKPGKGKWYLRTR